MKKLMTEWRSYLTEQEDAVPDREAGAGRTPEEAKAQKVREWFKGFTPEAYREVLQLARRDIEMGRPRGDLDPDVDWGLFLRGKSARKYMTYLVNKLGAGIKGNLSAQRLLKMQHGVKYHYTREKKLKSANDPRWEHKTGCFIALVEKYKFPL